MARDLLREEPIEALTELEADYRNGRISEEDYKSSQAEIAANAGNEP